MAVGFLVKYYWYQVGTADFLHSFFSSIAYNLEDKKWGSRYPIIMNELYGGNLGKEHLYLALEELDIIIQQLKRCSYEKVIWDIDDLTKQPPWGKKISSEITDLSNYFITSDGENLVIVLRHAIQKAIEVGSDVNISNM